MFLVYVPIEIVYVCFQLEDNLLNRVGLFPEAICIDVYSIDII